MVPGGLYNVVGSLVAVFFVVSEGAQTLFGAETGNEYYGIAAAGLLVLGIAPLQRFADRVAEKAVPRNLPGDTAEAQYRMALRIALANGSLNREEERLLAELADRVGLSVSQVMDMRAQEMGGG